MTSCNSLRWDDVIVWINADDVMHSINIGWCHSLFVPGKEQVTSEFPRVDVIKKCWDHNLYTEKLFLYNWLFAIVFWLDIVEAVMCSK